MKKSYDFLETDLGTIRAGRANPHVLDKIRQDGSRHVHNLQIFFNHFVNGHFVIFSGIRIRAWIAVIEYAELLYR